MNPACAELYGYAVEEMVGKPVRDVFAPEAHAQITRHIHSVGTKASPIYETVHVRKDGTTFPARLDIHSVCDSDDELLYRVIYVQDISEKRGLLTSLRETEEERAYMMSAARCLLWHAQVQDTGNPRYLDWNMTIPGYGGRAAVFAPRHAARRKLLRTPGIATATRRIGTCATCWEPQRCGRGRATIRSSGAIAVTAVCAGCMKTFGWKRWSRAKSGALVGVCTDITERKLAEQALLEKQASIEKLNERLRLSMTETHHRVKNNLQMISALIDMRAMEAGECSRRGTAAV